MWRHLRDLGGQSRVLRIGRFGFGNHCAAPLWRLIAQRFRCSNQQICPLTTLQSDYASGRDIRACYPRIHCLVFGASRQGRTAAHSQTDARLDLWPLRNPSAPSARMPHNQPSRRSRTGPLPDLLGGAMRNIARVIVLAAVGVLTLGQAHVGQRERPELGALSALRAIVSAQAEYASHNGAYAQSLQALAIPCPTRDRAFISPNLGEDPSVIANYEIYMWPGAPSESADCHGTPMTVAFYAAAVPVGEVADRYPSFGADQHGVIWSDANDAAGSSPSRKGRPTR